MSKKQHHSQDDLRGMFGDDAPDILKAFETIEEHEKSQKTQNKTKKEKKKKEPVKKEVFLTSGDAFCPNSAKGVLTSRLKGKHDFVVYIKDKVMTLNYINDSWELNTMKKTLRGKKLDLIHILCNEVAIAYQDE